MERIIRERFLTPEKRFTKHRILASKTSAHWEFLKLCKINNVLPKCCRVPNRRLPRKFDRYFKDLEIKLLNALIREKKAFYFHCNLVAYDALNDITDNHQGAISNIHRLQETAWIRAERTKVNLQMRHKRKLKRLIQERREQMTDKSRIREKPQFAVNLTGAPIDPTIAQAIALSPKYACRIGNNEKVLATTVTDIANAVDHLNETTERRRHKDALELSKDFKINATPIPKNRLS